MYLHRTTLSPHLWSQLRAQRERKAVPYCCKPLPDRKGSVVVRLPTHLSPRGLFFLVGARKCKKLWTPEVPPDFAQRAPGFESESLKFLARKLTSLQSRPGAVQVRHPRRRVQNLTILVFDCRDQANCRGHLRRESSVFQSTVGLSKQITEVVLDLDGPFRVADGSSSARI